MNIFEFARQNLSIFIVFLLTACGSSASKSPQFLPGSILVVTGKYLDEKGKEFSDQQLLFQNLRKFGYIDETGVAVESFGRLLAFPFFGFYDVIFNTDSLTVDRNKYLQSPN